MKKYIVFLLVVTAISIILKKSLFSYENNGIISSIMAVANYNELRLFYDFGDTYGLYQPEGSSYDVKYNDGHIEERKTSERKEVYSANDKGQGIGLQYSFGFGFLDYLSWKKKYFLNIGLIIDSKYIFSEDSNIGTISTGAEFGFFWIFTLSVGAGYAIFSKELPYIDHYENNGSVDEAIYKKKSLSGFYGFIQVGVNIPINYNYDIFAMLDMQGYRIDERKKSSSEGKWVRESWKFGIAYKF